MTNSSASWPRCAASSPSRERRGRLARHHRRRRNKRPHRRARFARSDGEGAAPRRRGCRRRWLTRIESLGVVAQVSFAGLGDVSGPLAARVSASPRLTCQTPGPNGDGPIRLMDDAAGRIARGEIAVAAVAGGEALRTAAWRKQQRAPRPARDGARYGLINPVEVYPLFDLDYSRPGVRRHVAEAMIYWVREADVDGFAPMSPAMCRPISGRMSARGWRRSSRSSCWRNGTRAIFTPARSTRATPGAGTTR